VSRRGLGGRGQHAVGRRQRRRAGVRRAPAGRVRGVVMEDFPFAGQLLDCDGHLYMEPDVMAEIVGGAGSSWIVDYLRQYVGTDADREARRRAESEVWAVKGISALGAYDARERIVALDKMGIHRQLLFPNTTL